MKRIFRKKWIGTVAVLVILVLAMPLTAFAKPLPRMLQGTGPLKISMLIPGNIRDGGFMQAGYTGLIQIKEKMGAEIEYIDGIKPEAEALSGALRKLAGRNPDMIIAHGGQCSQAAKKVASEFPDIKFVVVQGNVVGANLSSYEVLQEESAWLAGAAAGLLTQTGVVGHISGIRVPPGLKGRAAFADGLQYTNPSARLLTTFCGYQDDPVVAKKIAEAEILAGADIIFTMLNAGITGVIEAAREKGIHQIGNVRDWTQVHPDVFIASAIADSSLASVRAVQDLLENKWMAGRIVKIGIADSAAVSLAMGHKVPESVKKEIHELAEQIKKGNIKVRVTYDGHEF